MKQLKPRLLALALWLPAAAWGQIMVTTTNDSGAGSLRAAISNSASGATITFSNNLSGATILLTSGGLILSNNITITAASLPGGITINGNHANRVLYVDSGVTTLLTALTITNGSASDYGGGTENLGTLTVSNCTFTGNSAVTAGGAIRNTGILTIAQSTFAGNSSANGGALASAGTVVINQSTLSLNSATYGGGLYVNGPMTITNSIVAGNSASTGGDIDNLNALTFGGANIVLSITGNAATGTTPINAAPLLAPLNNYGGPTPTMPPLAGSPAIDAAINSSFTNDQRGYPRPMGAGPDIGAVEVDWPASDLFGNALSFNGSQYITISNFGAILPSNEMTVEFWAYATALSGGTFVLNPDGYPTNRFFAAVNYPDGNTYWEFGNVGAGSYASAATPPSAISNWVHYALVASQSGNYLRIYANGNLCANTTGMTPFVPGKYALQIGAGFVGMLDEFRVWNYALSEAQILAGMNTPLAGNEPGLVLYDAFDSSGGNIALNSATATGANYNGTTVNNPAWGVALEPSTAGSSASLAYTFTTLAGGSSAGSADGIGDEARFANPVGVAVDANGNVYVGDAENNTIRKITPAGVVTTLAGLAGDPGYTDGTAGTNGAARFNQPSGVALDQFGNLYVADSGNSVIRKLSTNGVVSTLASSSGQYVAVDNAGNVYATLGFSIVRISLAGQSWVETTLAGNPNVLGYSNGPAATALFNYPSGLAVDAFSNVYVCDELPAIREITSSGTVITLAGGTVGASNGLGANAQFYSPFGICVDSSSNIFVGDGHDDLVRRLTPVGTNWQVSTYAGVAFDAASMDGTGTNAKFGYPFGVAEDASGNVYVADQHFNNIRKITTAGVVTTLAGPGNSSAYLDGTGAEARFNSPSGVTTDGAGNIYVADTQNEVIRKITSAGVVSTLAGNPGVFGEMDGNGNQALFGIPTGIVADSAGNLYVTDNYYGVIRKVTPAGAVSTIAGSTQGYKDGPGGSALFNQPAGITMDSAGNLYVAEQAYNTIRMLTPAGTNWIVSTVAGYPQLDVHGNFTNGYTSTGYNAPNPTHIGAYADGTGAVARFNFPTGIAVDSAGNLYVADAVNSCVRKLVPPTVGSKTNAANWAVTTLAGVAGTNGDSDGAGATALFGFNFYNPGPTGIAVDGAGNVFVTDDGNNTIRRISPAGVVSTIAGLPLPDPFAMSFGGSADGTGEDARFNLPFAITVDSYGSLYVADQMNNTIRQGTFTQFGQASPISYTQPPPTGQLQVILTGANGNGQWHFPWEYTWRNSGTTASNLVPGSYSIEFSTVPGFLAFPASLSSIAVSASNVTVITNQYYPTLNYSGTTNTGGLTVVLGPNLVNGAWRFIGATQWLASGDTVTNLLPETYYIEFEPVSGFSSPPSEAIPVAAGPPTYISANYTLAQTPPNNVSLPVAVSSSSIADLVDYPFGYNGQLQTDVGYGSGVAVQTNVVLTAAHLVFNDETLSYVNQALWFWQAQEGFVPNPQQANGIYVLSGYAAQRTNDLLGGFAPDQSSPQSRNLDTAALYFNQPVAAGSYGGYLPSDAQPNIWLTSTANKMLVGYPVDGSVFGVTNIVSGQMYQVGPQPYPLTEAQDAVTNEQVYEGSWFLSYPGNSGGPFYVEYDGSYYPAGVYLGTLYNGIVPTASLVHGIDSNVVNMINFAQNSATSGTNNSGGGVITVIPGAGIAKNPGLVEVTIAPPGAFNGTTSGGAWKFSTLSDAYYSTVNPSSLAVTTTNSLQLQFRQITGWNLPTNQSLSVKAGTLASVTASYTVAVNWPVPAPITYGAPLGSNQLDATVSVTTGVFAYAPTNGAILSPGANTLSVTFTPSNTAQYGGSSTTNVSLVVLPPAPVIQTAQKSSTSFTFTWSAISNQTYQIQSTTNLNQTNWKPLGSTFTATNSTMTTLESAATNAQQFYRVVLLP